MGQAKQSGRQVAWIIALLAAAPAQAEVGHTGWGIANHLEDPGRQQSRDFDELRPRSFRFLAEWESLGSADYRRKVQAVIDEAKAGARPGTPGMEIMVTFSCPRPARLGRAPDAGRWIAPVARFIDRFTGDVEWWGPVNEPNHPDCILRSDPALVASYSIRLRDYLAAHSSTGDLMVSPDFHDHYAGDELAMSGSISTVARYIANFRAAGGRFGSAVAWHPYGGIQRRSMLSTNDLAATLEGHPETRDLPIWVTEAGALIYLKRDDGTVSYENTPEGQNERVAFMRDSLARHGDVVRMNYYNMRHDGNPQWDSALVGADGRRRPAWYTWCEAARADEAGRSNDAACYDDWPSVASWGPSG